MPLISLILALLATLMPLAAGLAPATGYAELLQRAETLYTEESFARSHQTYEEASQLSLSKEERRWVEMRLADTAWRAAAKTSDPTPVNEAVAALEELIRKSGDDHDRVWAEANESLADHFWMERYGRDSGRAQPLYRAALDWWSGSDDLTLARRRYLAIVWRMTRWNDQERFVPRDILLDALSIAQTPEDRAHAHYLIAKTFLAEGRPESIERGFEHLDAVIREGKATEWYDDALFDYATQLSNTGTVIVLDNGDTTIRKDYPKALELFRRLVTEFKREETKYYDQARSAIAEIETPAVSLLTESTFLPDSEQEVVMEWRNSKQVELTVSKVDLTKDVQPDPENRSELADLPDRGAPVVIRRWTFTTNDHGDHAPGTERIRMTPRLPVGAYLVAASVKEDSSRQLLLVTDANVLLHSSQHAAEVFVSNALTGEPMPGARVRIWKQKDEHFFAQTGETGPNGLARFQLDSDAYGMMDIFVSSPNGSQAWLSTYHYSYPVNADLQWRIYAFTDRPAYRPNESVHWKIIARTRGDNRWQLPKGRTIAYEIVSPRNETVASGTAELNAFGSFWGDLALTPTMPLGAYQIRFKTTDKDHPSIGQAQLFQLEEYKLPEFRVAVTPADDHGKPKQYRLGDTVEATVEATYYFGGPVANASVELRVTSQPYFHYWYPWHVYEWYYDEDRTRYGGYGGTEVRHETLKTDANGRTVVRIETPRDGGDLSYTITANVVDASRRTVFGTGTVRVTKQRYSVSAWPEHAIHRPNEKVSIDFKAQDANDLPVEMTGTVKVIRRHWEIATSKARAMRPDLGAYRDDDVMTAKVTSNAKGEATLTFTAPREGYYLVKWTSEDRQPGKPLRAGDLVTAETTVWVTRRDVNDIGYHANGLDIIVDKDTLRAGATAPVMIVTPSSGRWVMLSTSAGELLDTQVLHLDGTVKLVELPITERHTPNFFITASSVFDRTLATETKRLVVPPVEHFVSVDVKPDHEQYEPRQKGSLTVTTRDADGKPVAVEVALSVSDESVTAIAQDPAGDPRRYFFNEPWAPSLTVATSVQAQRYVRLIAGKDGQLIDEREAERLKEEKDGERDDARNEHGVVGGVVGGVLGAPHPAPPPPPAPKAAAQEMMINGAPSYERLMAKADVSGWMDMDATRAGRTAPIEVTVRSDFRSTALWKPDVITGPDGNATVTVDYPEALTTWRATARAVTADSQFGMATATSRTNLPLMVRLEGPRFFVAGDRAVISAVINNNSDEAMRVKPSIEVEGVRISDPAQSPEVDVPAHGESRADWTVIAEQAGTAKLRVTGRTATRGDAMEKSFTVYEHGIDKLIARSGKLRSDEAIVKLDLPHERRGTNLTVQMAPTLAVTMLDALPYLLDYPYGCTEQTMSRFLPAAIIARTLAKNGLSPNDIEGHLFGGVEQEHAGVTHPKGSKPLARLDAITTSSMARLYDFQHSDGGWGWWKEGQSDDFMTAYIVWGFSIAKEGELPVNAAAIERAATWLDQELVKHENDPGTATWMLHAVAAWRRVANENAPNAAERKAFDRIWSQRQELTAYSRALLALTAHDFHDAERAQVLVRNLEDGVKVDRTPDQSILLGATKDSPAETMATAHWGYDRFWWRWYDGPVETTAFVLQALVTIDPQNRLVEPAMNWLVKNRRGAQWNNTRDTAISLLALNDYLHASGELQGDVAYELSVNGQVVASKRITASAVLSAPSLFTVEPSAIRDGVNEIHIRRTSGHAPLYFSAMARFVSLEEPVTAAGNELFVRRDYLRLVPRPTLLKGVVYEKVPLNDGETITSGDRLEVVVTVEAKNDYEYLLFEDLKPAGLEAMALQSGSNLFAIELREASVPKKLGAGEKPTLIRRDPSADATGRTAWVYQELRDRKVAMFIDHMPQGTWEIRYSLRAEVPGSFHALPLLGQAMYVPEVRANGNEVRVVVSDR
jgi:uncharacterized protein YfaS (alpha-2-macroglobulin family)